MTLRVPANLRAAVHERRTALDQLSLDPHGTPESRFEEHYAVEQLAARLAVANFDVDKDVGLPRAFTATHRGSSARVPQKSVHPAAPSGP